MTFTIDRKGESLEIPVKPAEAPDGTGRIGVQLAANAQVTRNVSKDPLQAVQLAAKQFGKLTKTVVMGRHATDACKGPAYNVQQHGFEHPSNMQFCHVVHASVSVATCCLYMCGDLSVTCITCSSCCCCCSCAV